MFDVNLDSGLFYCRNSKNNQINNYYHEAGPYVLMQQIEVEIEAPCSHPLFTR